MDEAAAWAKRDAGVVWHGFTQMSAYAENAPVIVERAEGHELIDVDGKRYLDAISSLWVNTLGHRVPELDDAIREQLDRGAHSTMLGNGNRVVVELCEALAPRRAGRRARTSCSRPTAPRRSSRRSRSRSSTGRTGRRGAHHVPRVRRRVPRRHDRRALRRRRRVRHRPLRPAALPGAARPRSPTPTASTRRVRMVAEHAHELAAVIVEPLVQGAAGMQLARPGRRSPRSALRAASTTCCSSATRSRPASGARARCSRRSSAGCGPTCSCSARASPAGTSPMSAHGRERPRLRRVPRARPLGEDAVPRPLVRRERARRRGRAPPPRAARGAGRARQRAGPLRRAARAARRAASRRMPAVREVAAARPDGRRRARAARATGCAGDGACSAAAVRARRAAPPARRRRRAHAAAHDHRPPSSSASSTRSAPRSTRSCT